MIYTPESLPEGRWRNFSWRELACKHTDICDVDPDMMNTLQLLRTDINAPITISSGYRHPTHPVEAKKDKPGTHTTGKAVDIVCYGVKAHRVLELAARQWYGIGIKQHGPMNGRFIHLDMVKAGEVDHISRPWLWSYQ